MGSSILEVRGSLLEWSSYLEKGTSKERKRKRGSGPGADEEETWKRPTRIRLSKGRAGKEKWMRKQDEEAWQEQDKSRDEGRG